MKRFHVHVSVEDLAEGIRFYSAVFGAAPAVEKPDYAKWMLDDPRVNFAISTRGRRPGVNHLGLQVESAEEMRQMRANLERAGTALREQTGVSCCYARSDKYWVTDPAGVAWETFHSLGDVPVYGESHDAQAGSFAHAQEAGCCGPRAGEAPARAGEAAKQSCCS